MKPHKYWVRTWLAVLRLLTSRLVAGSQVGRARCAVEYALCGYVRRLADRCENCNRANSFMFDHRNVRRDKDISARGK